MLKNFMPFFHRLKHKVVFSVSSFFRTDEQQELLKTVNTHLLIWNHELMNLETGQRVILSDMCAETIAIAAKELVVVDAKNKQTLHVALYLANTEVVATEYELSGVAAHNIASALNYQVNELMPAYPGKLMLAVNHDESRDKNIALWLDYNRTEALFSAFKAQAVELTTVIPRILLTSLIKAPDAKKEPVRQYRDHDENALLQITVNNHNITQWQSISNKDIKDQSYYQEWERESQPLSGVTQIESADFWPTIDTKNIELLAYTFFPESTLRNLKKHSRLKKGRLAAIAGIIIIVLISLPFIKNVVRYKKYELRYQDYQEQTAALRNMRSSVTEFEDNWGLFTDYPKANIPAAIHKLNTIIPKDSWIQGFEIKNGFIEIDGYSPNPTNILEIISRQGEFEQAAFNQRTRGQRGKQNEHFGITFRLNTINVEAYQEKYFPVN